MTIVLRAAGHDVVAVVESLPSADDDTIAAFARREQRAVVTEDYDFGEIAVRFSGLPDGVILIDPPSTPLDARPALVVDFLLGHAAQLPGKLAILKGSRIRWRAL